MPRVRDHVSQSQYDGRLVADEKSSAQHPVDPSSG